MVVQRKKYPVVFPSIAQSGSASGLGPEGREFESLYSDHIMGD